MLETIIIGEGVIFPVGACYKWPEFSPTTAGTYELIGSSWILQL